MKIRSNSPILMLCAALAALAMSAGAPRMLSADPTDRQAAITQVAAFTERPRAEAMVKALTLEGKAAVLLEKTVDGVDYYAVLVDSMPLGDRHAKTAAPETAAAPETSAPAPKTPEPQTPEESFKDINEGPFEQITLEPLYPDSAATISLMSNTPVYISPVEGSPFIGTYRSLGGAQYAGVMDGWHSLWLPIENYGYVRSADAKVVPAVPGPQ